MSTYCFNTKKSQVATVSSKDRSEVYKKTNYMTYLSDKLPKVLSEVRTDWTKQQSLYLKLRISLHWKGINETP